MLVFLLNIFLHLYELLSIRKTSQFSIMLALNNVARHGRALAARRRDAVMHLAKGGMWRPQTMPPACPSWHALSAAPTRTLPMACRCAPPSSSPSAWRMRRASGMAAPCQHLASTLAGKMWEKVLVRCWHGAAKAVARHWHGLGTVPRGEAWGCLPDFHARPARLVGCHELKGLVIIASFYVTNYYMETSLSRPLLCEICRLRLFFSQN